MTSILALIALFCQTISCSNVTRQYSQQEISSFIMKLKDENKLDVLEYKKHPILAVYATKNNIQVLRRFIDSYDLNGEKKTVKIVCDPDTSILPLQLNLSDDVITIDTYVVGDFKSRYKSLNLCDIDKSSDYYKTLYKTLESHEILDKLDGELLYLQKSVTSKMVLVRDLKVHGLVVDGTIEILRKDGEKQKIRDGRGYLCFDNMDDVYAIQQFNGLPIMYSPIST